MAFVSPLTAVLLPLAGALGIGLAGRRPNLRDGVTLLTAAVTFAAVLKMAAVVDLGARPGVALLTVVPGVRLAFQAEPLGILYGLIASGLWILNSLYSIGYMRAGAEKHQTRFYVCFALAIGSALGIAFAENLFTLFVFYELLTLVTYPLVTHKGTPEALRAGRIYLTYLLFTSTCLLLLAILWTYLVAGTLRFTPGGILAGKVAPGAAALLFVLYVLGAGKAAVMPFHFWLPSAMVAPTPVSALLHAVAVVKAGVFVVLKVAVYVFGVDYLGRVGAGEVAQWLAAGTILGGSLVALVQDNLKARLAYSTVSQLSYMVLGAALGTTLGIAGGSLHIAMHAFGKITLFFCAGAIYVAHHKTEVSQLQGLGRKMPLTFAAFLVGALSIVGVPPLGGAWSKWYLALGTLSAGKSALLVVLLVSSLLNVLYLVPVAVRAFFVPADREENPGGIQEAPLFCLVPTLLCAVGCIVLFLWPESFFRFASQITP